VKEIWLWLKPADYKDKEGNNVIMDWWMVIFVKSILSNDTFRDIVRKAEKIFLILENVTNNKSINYEIEKKVAFKLLKGYSNMKVLEALDQDFPDIYVYDRILEI
jgi:hypothetical protein